MVKHVESVLNHEFLPFPSSVYSSKEYKSENGVLLDMVLERKISSKLFKLSRLNDLVLRELIPPSAVIGAASGTQSVIATQKARLGAFDMVKGEESLVLYDGYWLLVCLNAAAVDKDWMFFI
ncbi:hypothetical protein GOBAR_DD34081 [Gossypium barbadense]|nr:hypothetical protein GOBAR_DD34081 [Gossypium barbadense]